MITIGDETEVQSIKALVETSLLCHTFKIDNVNALDFQLLIVSRDVMYICSFLFRKLAVTHTISITPANKHLLEEYCRGLPYIMNSICKIMRG